MSKPSNKQLKLMLKAAQILVRTTRSRDEQDMARKWMSAIINVIGPQE